MKILECIKDDDYLPEHLKWIKEFPIKGNYYGIRKIVMTGNGQKGYLLNEIKNPNMPNNYEPSFHSSRFKEIKEDDININELINELEKEIQE